MLAADIELGWMLMSDAGEPLRSVVARERSLDRWLDVLRLCAGVELDLSDAVVELLALGVPDMPLANLPHRYLELMDEIDAEPVFRDATARVTERCEQLAAYGIPETVQHDDLHDGQVFVRDGRHLLMDWGDACVSHPFFTLSVTLEGVVAWVSTTSRTRSTSVPSAMPSSPPTSNGTTATSPQRATSRCGSAGPAEPSTDTSLGTSRRPPPVSACSSPDGSRGGGTLVCNLEVVSLTSDDMNDHDGRAEIELDLGGDTPPPYG